MRPIYGDNLGFAIVRIAGLLGVIALLLWKFDGSFVLALSVGLIGLVLYLIGSRLRVETYGEARRRDPRPPVLFLRPFSLDLRPRRVLMMGVERPLEEVIVEAFQEVGPVVALGGPYDLLPVRGAVRRYVCKKKWKSTVAEAVGEAIAVILTPGRSDGAVWEMEHLVACNVPLKVLLVIPTTEPIEFAKYWDCARRALPAIRDSRASPQPPRVDEWLVVKSDVAHAPGLFMFDRGWNARQLPPRLRKVVQQVGEGQRAWEFPLSLEVDYQATLQPFFSRLPGYEPRGPEDG